MVGIDVAYEHKVDRLPGELELLQPRLGVVRECARPAAVDEDVVAVAGGQEQAVAVRGVEDLEPHDAPLLLRPRGGGDRVEHLGELDGAVEAGLGVDDAEPGVVAPSEGLPGQR